MTIYLDDIKERFEKYYRLEERMKNFSLEELQKLPDSYRDFLNIKSDLKALVLTGEEIIEIGLGKVDDLTDEDIEDSEKYLKSEEKLEKYKEVYQTLKEIYKELKEEHEEELRKPKSNLSAIEKIIAGKSGSIIDEISEIIREDN